MMRNCILQFCRAVLALGALLTITAISSQAGTFTALAPQTYTRSTGAPVTVTSTFSVLNPNTQYTLKAFNGGLQDDQTELVSSGFVTVNGVQVIGPSNFNQNVSEVDVPVSLQTSNTISVQVRGKPGGVLTIEIIGVDNDPPTITATVSPTPNSAGWNNTNVTVTFVCGDLTSGVASCPAAQTVTTEGALQVISGTATDAAGNSASTSVTLNIDKTPPTITAAVSPAPNAAGWNNSNVTVSFTCSDSLSGVANCPSPATLTTEGANQAVSGTATDVAGNNASTSVTVKLDKTPPTIGITSPANGATFSSSSVGVTGTVSDALSGVSAVTCDGTPAAVQSGSFTCSITLTPGANTITAQASDVAGNTSSATESVTLQNAPPPVINSFTPTSAAAGAQVTLTGSNLTGNGTATPQVALSQQGGGSIAAPVTSFTADSINFIIPAGAASGQVTVTVGKQSGVSSASLNVVPSSSFVVVAGPSSANVQQGTSTSYSVTLASNNGFSQLAQLSVTGLPSGVTGSFSPTQITAGQTSIFKVSAPAGQTVGNSTLTISAAATVEGIPTTQSASVGLNVQAASTSLIGRIVESDNNETPIPGITATFLGVDDAGNKTGCSGQTRSDAAGNFAFTNLATSCLGRQLVSYDGNTATDGEKYAGVNLAYTMVAGQITGPELVHLPAISDAETIMVKQNATVDQVFSYSTIPGITVTVYAGTTLTLPNGNQPDPFPMAAVLVPVDRLPDAPTPTTGTLRASIVAFQPADTTSNQPVSVTFPNVVNTPPGVNMELDTLDPIVGELVKYGTGTVSGDASEIVPDSDPAHPGHRFGISHFDWHGPMAPAPNSNNPCPSPPCTNGGDPVDLSSGLLTFTKTDMAFGGARGTVAIQRTYRTLSGAPGPFGVGTNHNYGYLLDTSNLVRGTGTFVNLVMPDGNQFPFAQQGTNTFVNSNIPSLLGAVITTTSPGVYKLRWKNGGTFQFQTLGGALLAFLTAITDPNGNTVTLMRTNPSQPIQISQIIDPVGRTLAISYDNFNRILSVTDPIGRLVQYAYNSQGTLATVTDPAGGVTAYGYDSQNRLASIRDPRNIVYLQNSYDANGRVIQQTAADGGVTTFVYTLLNPTVPTSPVLLTTVTDPRGNATIYHFNSQGFLLDTTDALGQKTIYTRDPGTNQVLGVVDSLNRATAFTYDANGNATSVTRLAGTPNAVTTSMTYDSFTAKITSITDPLNHVTNLTYDSAGNLLSMTDPLNHRTSFAYDAMGELISSTDPIGSQRRFVYSNGALSSVTDPIGNVTTLVSDAIGRVLSTTTPLGQTNSYSYDALSQLSQTADVSGKITKFTHDPNGNLLSVTNAAGQVTSYTYNSMDRVAAFTDPLSRTESYQYDLAGNLIQFTDRRGVVTAYKYDSLNRQSLMSFGVNGNSFESSIASDYDAGNRVTAIVDSVAGTISETYDGLDRLVQENTPQGAIAYRYDAAGRRTEGTVAGQLPVSYTYDSAGRLTQAIQGAVSIGISYDDDGRRSSVTLPNGIQMSYFYDGDSRLTKILYSLGSKVLGDLSYSYDGLGRRIGVGGAFARTNLPQAVSSATYDAANELTNWNGAALSYDNNGDMLSDGSHAFTWNARNQLASVNGQSLEYDAFGRRIKNIAGTSFLYDGVNVAQEIAGGTPSVNLLVDSVDETFLRSDSSGSVTPLTDALGSTIALADGSGSIQTVYTYEPFGNVSASGQSNANEFLYAGRENDGNGLYYYRARYYSPVLGRFISEDPLGFAAGINFYAYVADDPINLVDPMGLDGWTRALGGLQAVGGAFETAAGVGLAIATGWTGIGAVAGVGVGLHGLDQVQAGLRELFGGCHVDSFTSQGLQAAGMSQSAANLTDAGISVVGSLGAGTVTQGIRAGVTGLSDADRILYYEIGQQTLSPANYEVYGQIADPVERGMAIAEARGSMLKGFLPDPGGVSQFGNTLPKGPTPLAGGAVGALGGAANAAGGGLGGRKPDGCGH